MTKLPVVSGRKLLRILRKNGFNIIRQRGSHVFIESEDGLKGTVIPVHAGEDLGKGILKSILTDLDMDTDDPYKMLHS